MLVGWFILNLSDDGKYGLVNCRKWDSPELTSRGLTFHLEDLPSRADISVGSCSLVNINLC